MKMTKCVYIYGAGVYGRECCKNLMRTGYVIKAFVVSDKDDNPEMLFSTSVIDRNEFLNIYKGERVFVAMRETNQTQVINWLEVNNIDYIPYMPLPLINDIVNSNINAIALECLKYKNIYIYGAGVYARKCFSYLLSVGIKINAFVVTSSLSNPDKLFGIPVIPLGNLTEDERDSFFVLALKPAFQKNILPLLKENEIVNFILYKNIDAQDFTSAPLKSEAEMVNFLVKRKGKVYNQDELINNSCSSQKKVLLVSHELSLTGAPLALYSLAKVIKNNGGIPVFVSPKDGLLREKLQEEGYAVIIFNLLLTSNIVIKFVDLFDNVVCSTILTASIVNLLKTKNISTLWWIHDCKSGYNERVLEPCPKTISCNIKVCCGGSYARSVFNSHFPDIPTSIFLYYIPDFLKQTKDREIDYKILNPEGKKVFAVIGTLEPRKGQTVFCNAIRMLPDEIRQNCLFYIIGSHDHIDQETRYHIEKLVSDYSQNVCIINQLSRDCLVDFYRQMDCLVCSSTDDPMPTVVTDALCLKRMVICSENTGSAELLREYKTGYVYRNNSAQELANCMVKFYNGINTDEQYDMMENGRKLYEENFTEECFEEKAKVLLDI